MARIEFVKMHGLGNDFLILDEREGDGAASSLTFAQIARLADRRTGVGFDQLILLQPTGADGADFAMRIFNADGGEVEACGNAARAVAILHGGPARVQTDGGVIGLAPDGGGAVVDMGCPRFDWEQIPLAYAMDTTAMPVSWEGLENPFAVNVGNPHVVFFVPGQDGVELERLGPTIETDALFPDRINVNVASIRDDAGIDLRVWERGVGLTRACGTGACATAVAAISRGLAASPVSVHLPGGALSIAWSRGEPIMMSGPARESYRGSFNADDFA